MAVRMVAGDFSEIELIVNTDNPGFGRANNQALPGCTGRHIVLLNPDTLILDGAVARLIGRMDACPDVAVMGCRLLNADRTLQTLHLADRVRILEDVDDEALPILLRHARLMIYPSHAEGFGMPVLEALASGVPVITSDSTSLPEVAGQAAWLASPDDVDQLATCLRDALREAEPARAVRIEQGLRHAARFSWQDSARNLLQAVHEAM